ncbi:hypothetical protein GF380_00140 [Candidatus Uhrbacteria bacterium]|nr:hypothetical protein [Candidatus Uhrbacteria bacterium]MBD3283833.1 hypothetical protein [Candidatus Uhrbacteria bacterium]
MPQLNFLHICNDAFMSDGTKALNVIGIFDQVHAKQFPVLIPKFSTVAHVHAMEGAHKLRMIIRKDEQQLAEVKSEFFGTNHQWISHYAGMAFKEPGEYVFELFVDEELTGTKRLQVKQEGS